MHIMTMLMVRVLTMTVNSWEGWLGEGECVLHVYDPYLSTFDHLLSSYIIDAKKKSVVPKSSNYTLFLFMNENDLF